MEKLMIGKIMFKSTITKIIIIKLMIIKLIMAKPTNKILKSNKNNLEYTNYGSINHI
jgi:hypothetical protein